MRACNVGVSLGRGDEKLRFIIASAALEAIGLGLPVSLIDLGRRSDEVLANLLYSIRSLSRVEGYSVCPGSLYKRMASSIRNGVLVAVLRLI